jgi:mannosyltransferase OCH1-like enzyme
MQKIPKIIHQTWKDKKIPMLYQPLIDTWRENHTDWQFVLWTDEMNRDLIEKKHPDFLSSYDSFPLNIQRVDAARYFILYEYGGVYIDLDFECLANIEPLLSGYDSVFAMEPLEHCLPFEKQMIICNAFMACTATNDFFYEICSNLKNTSFNNCQSSSMAVLESTGPLKLTEVYDKYLNKELVNILSSNTVYPLSKSDRRTLLNGEKMSLKIKKRLDEAYAIHYFLGSWWN